MKANEFRLGNKIIRNGIIVTVDEQTFWDIKHKPDEYKPVPLAEEWLLKLGFYKLDGFYRLRSIVVSAIHPNGEFHFQMGNYPVSYRYVHQLQNLYFALTGKELTYE